jgi:hypothetical protein
MPSEQMLLDRISRVQAALGDIRSLLAEADPRQRQRFTRILRDLLPFAVEGAPRSCGCRMTAKRCALTGIRLDPRPDREKTRPVGRLRS